MLNLLELSNKKALVPQYRGEPYKPMNKAVGAVRVINPIQCWFNAGFG